MSDLKLKRWYVIYSKPQKEESAAFHLRLKGLEVLFLQLLLPEYLRKRKRIVPLFPNYLFVRIDISAQYQQVVWTPGIKRFVSFNDTPVPLDDGIVAFSMQKANPDGIITACSTLKEGQEVQIRGGPFDGLVGISQEPPDGRGRVSVLMELLSRQVKADVPVQFVNSGWVV